VLDELHEEEERLKKVKAEGGGALPYMQARLG